MTTKEKIISIIAGIIEEKPENITLDSGIGDFAKWDSLGSLNILQEIQDEFDIEIEPEEIIELEDVNDIVNITERKISEK